MTEVFQILTQQKSFDLVRVKRLTNNPGQPLTIKVSSSRASDSSYDPESVLNGQASSALKLIPYFAFSDIQAEALRLDLLVIDDPSQSFDTQHISLLLDVLSKAATHAQVVLATHENERFKPLLAEHIDKDETILFMAEEFDVDRGPNLVIDS